MFSLEQRKRRGEEALKMYRHLSGGDSYGRAVDAIADILLFIAQSENEATQILHSAEMDFRNAFESEQIVAEG